MSHQGATLNRQHAILIVALALALTALLAGEPHAHSAVSTRVASGLLAYGPSLVEMYGTAAACVDKILKGAKPADLPVEQPATFELLINVLPRAGQVID